MRVQNRKLLGFAHLHVGVDAHASSQQRFAQDEANDLSGILHSSLPGSGRFIPTDLTADAHGRALTGRGSDGPSDARPLGVARDVANPPGQVDPTQRLDENAYPPSRTLRNDMQG